MQRQCRAKIVATLGPASSTRDVIRDLLSASNSRSGWNSKEDSNSQFEMMLRIRVVI